VSDNPILDAQGDIVERLLDRLPYLAAARGGTCRGVARLADALLEDVAPPANLIEFAGGPSNDPLIVSVARQFTRYKCDVFSIARNFSAFGDPAVGDIGVYQMLADTKRALLGYLLPTPKNSTGSAYAKLWHVETGRTGLYPASVIYFSQWRCDLIDRGEE